MAVPGSEKRLAAGCAGGMALASAGSWLRFWLEGTLRLDTHTTPFVVACGVSGLGLIVSGACALRLAPRAGRLPWPSLWRWTIVTHALAALGLALTSNDVFTYLTFGALRRAGLSPYQHVPGDLAGSPLLPLASDRWAHVASPYGPLFHPIAAAAAWAGDRLGSPVWGSFYAFKAIVVAAVLGALAVAARHLRAWRPEAAREIWVPLALGPVVAWEVSAQGHNDGLLLLAVVLFLVAAAASREAPATVALAAGVAIKYPVAPLLGLYLLLVARRSLLRAAVLALLGAAVLVAAFAPEWGTVTLRSVTPMLGGEATRHAHSLTDLICLGLDLLGRPEASAIAYRVLSRASALVCAAALFGAAWTARSLAALGRGYLCFLFALFLTAPWFQPWYVLWALPFALVEEDPRWRRLVAQFTIASVALWAVPLDPITTVLVDAWAALRLWTLRRRPAPALAEPAASDPARYRTVSAVVRAARDATRDENV